MAESVYLILSILEAKEGPGHSITDGCIQYYYMYLPNTYLHTYTYMHAHNHNYYVK